MPRYDDLVLYYKGSCPYCVKVLKFIEANDIQVELRDTLDPQNQNDLIKIGGKRQVPCLIIDGTALYESDDIIRYLRDRSA